MEPIDLVPEYPLHISRAAVEFAMQLEGHLLSAGERCTVTRWLTMDDDEAHVLTRLLWRKVHPVRVDSFVVPGVEDLDTVLEGLQHTGFVDGNSHIPRAMKIARMTVRELRDLAKAHGVPSTGNRARLLDRTRTLPLGRHGPTLIRPRHVSLFRRMHRAYLRSHDSDLSNVVLEQMGRRRGAVYTPTGGVGRFQHRRAMKEYERARTARMQDVDDTEWVRQLTMAGGEVDRTEKPPAHRWRFSARRMWEDLAARCLRHAERVETAETVYTLYAHHLQKDLLDRGRIRYRAALTAGRSGRPIDGVNLCDQEWNGDFTDYARIRTGKRLAKQGKVPWNGPCLPPDPPATVLTTDLQPTRGLWSLDDHTSSVEQVVIDHLSAEGLEGFHVESAAWTTLFGLLYREALFAPVPGMLPTPHLRGPVDLGTPEFLQRRTRWIATIESDIEQGRGSARLRESWEQAQGQDIVGVRWTAMPIEALCWLVDAIPPGALLAIMNKFGSNWWQATRGWPDLVVLDRSGNDPKANTVQLIEVKGPNDSLRDAQRWWLQELARLEIRAQVWSVVPRAG